MSRRANSGESDTEPRIRELNSRYRNSGRPDALLAENAPSPITGLQISPDPLSPLSIQHGPRNPSRRRIRTTAIVVAAIIITLLTSVLPYNSPGSALLLDRQLYSIFPYPFTIQNIIYLLLAWSLADSYVRWRMTKREYAFLNAGFLPEDSITMLELHELDRSVPGWRRSA